MFFWKRRTLSIKLTTLTFRVPAVLPWCEGWLPKRTCKEPRKTCACEIFHRYVQQAREEMAGRPSTSPRRHWLVPPQKSPLFCTFNILPAPNQSFIFTSSLTHVVGREKKTTSKWFFLSLTKALTGVTPVWHVLVHFFVFVFHKGLVQNRP